MIKCNLCNTVPQKLITDVLRDGTARKVYLCEKCDLGILDESKSDVEYKEYYAGEYRKIGKPKIAEDSNSKELFEMYEPFQSDRIRLLKPYFTKKTKLLEIGCSAGMFLYHAKKYVGEVVGIDYDKQSADFAAKKCVCKTYSTDIKETGLKKGYFDIICAFQTLEHVKDPSAFIKELTEYLRPGGIIEIEVPNLRDALVDVYDLPFHQKFYFHSSHLWYFTGNSLKKVMQKNGVRGKVSYLQDYNLLNHIFWLQNDKPQGDCNYGLSLPRVPIRSTRRVVGNKIQNLIIKFDSEYKKILEKNKVTSNLFFIGKK